MKKRVTPRELMILETILMIRRNQSSSTSIGKTRKSVMKLDPKSS